jgi:hypothetical protein
MIKLSIGEIQRIELVATDGSRHNLANLPREDYEHFLAKMDSLRIAYGVLASINDSRNRSRASAGRGEPNLT